MYSYMAEDQFHGADKRLYLFIQWINYIYIKELTYISGVCLGLILFDTSLSTKMSANYSMHQLTIDLCEGAYQFTSVMSLIQGEKMAI